MKLPNYNGNNTVNLISNIKFYCGLESEYKKLDLLEDEKIENYDNIVLFLVDALGYKWLEKYGKNSFLYSKLAGSISSIFPSTTATAVTTFFTGFTSSEHGVTGRNMFSKEVGGIIQILPWKYKISETDLGNKIDIKNLITKNNFYKDANKDIFTVTNSSYLNSNYNKLFNKNSKILSYNDLSSCFNQVENSVKYNNKQKYIYAYWSEFDSISHKYGIDSNELKNHFDDIDCHFKKLEKKLAGTNSLIIITADHGQLNCNNHINIKKDYSEIYEMLSLPFTGEPRCQFCFVKTGLQNKFYNKVKEKLGFCLDIFTKKEILEMKLFGNSETEIFLEKIGDFVLLPKNLYTINDYEEKNTIGNHGGISDWETLVPLIKFKT